MTSSNGNNSSNRLDRIEALVEANSLAIDRNSQTIDRLAAVAQASLSISQNTRENLQQTEQLTRRNAAANRPSR